MEKPHITPPEVNGSKAFTAQPKDMDKLYRVNAPPALDSKDPRAQEILSDIESGSASKLVTPDGKFLNASEYQPVSHEEEFEFEKEARRNLSDIKENIVPVSAGLTLGGISSLLSATGSALSVPSVMAAISAGTISGAGWGVAAISLGAPVVGAGAAGYLGFKLAKVGWNKWQKSRIVEAEPVSA